jgi:hypothetical protein
MDPQENQPIRSDLNEETKQITDKIITSVANHLKSIEPVENQFSVKNAMWLPQLQECCNFPYCTCIDRKYADPESHMDMDV